MGVGLYTIKRGTIVLSLHDGQSRASKPMMEFDSPCAFFIDLCQPERTGRKKISKMKNVIRCSFCVLQCLITISVYAQSYNISVPKAGKLSSLLKGKKESVVELKISGSINGRDITYIRELPNLEKLDLAEVFISADKSTLFSMPIKEDDIYVATDNELPNGCLAGLQKLTSIVLPASLQGGNPFYSTTASSPHLKEITVLAGTVSLSGCDELEKIVLGKNAHVSGYRKKVELIELMEEIDYSEQYAFRINFSGFRPHYVYFKKQDLLILYDSYGTNEIKDGVTIIWEAAFERNATLTDLVLPNSVRKIRAQAFAGCPNLRTVVLPSNLLKIGHGAFDCPNLQRITLPASLVSIAQNSINSHNLIVTSLMKEPTEECPFIPKLVKAIFVPEESYDAYKKSSWKECPLFKLGGQKEFILTVEAGNLLKSIGIDNIPSVERLILSGTIDETDLQVISQMVNLKYIDMENIQMKQSLQMQKKRQTDIKSIKTLLDSAGKIAVKGDMNAEENINGCIIPNEIFANQTALETVILPKNTAIIAADAFSGCKNLKTVKMPEGLLSVKARAFQGCTSLERVVFPTLLEIEWDVFNGCNLLSDVLFPEGLLRMDFSIFQGTQVTHVDIPSTVRKIGGLFGIEDNVKEVHCKATVPPELKRKYVENSDKQYRIYIPAGSSTAYNKAWGNLNFVEE